MKHNKIIWLLVSGILIFSLTGCQPTAATTSPAPTSNPTAPQQISPTEGSYPASSSQANPAAGSYPASSSQPIITAVPYPSSSDNLSPTASSYPSPQGGAVTIPWDQAEQIIMTGNVTSLVQTQSLDVTLTLKTGETYKTTAPAADAAQKAITTCGEPCKTLTVTNQ